MVTICIFEYIYIFLNKEFVVLILVPVAMSYVDTDIGRLRAIEVQKLPGIAIGFTNMNHRWKDVSII